MSSIEIVNLPLLSPSFSLIAYMYNIHLCVRLCQFLQQAQAARLRGSSHPEGPRLRHQLTRPHLLLHPSIKPHPEGPRPRHQLTRPHLLLHRSIRPHPAALVWGERHHHRLYRAPPVAPLPARPLPPPQGPTAKELRL